MKKGKIVEDGDHDSLLRDYPSGLYAKLVSEAQNAEMEEEDNGPVDKEQLRPNIAPTESQPVQIQVNLGSDPFGGKGNKVQQKPVNHEAVIVQDVDDESGEIAASINLGPK